MISLNQFWESLSKILLTPIFKAGSTTITLSSILVASVILIASVFVAKAAEKLVNKALSKRKLDRGIQGSLERFVRYIVTIFGALISLDTMGISIGSLAALGAVLMVGIGFGLQNITQNFISGIILLLERPIKTGDLIKIGDDTGRVLDIRVRSTIVITRDDVALIVPNSNLVSEVVTNECFQNERVRTHVKDGVAY